MLALAALGSALLLPGPGRFGLWEPWERRIADEAAALAGLRRPLGGTTGGPQVLAGGHGLRLFGFDEGGARLPGALIAVGTLLGLAWAGASLYGRRAGIAAALVLAATPLFVLQARQLTSDVPLLLASALALGGLGRLGIEPSAAGRPGGGACPGGTGAGGAGTGGVLVGVVPLCLAFTAAWLLSALQLAAALPPRPGLGRRPGRGGAPAGRPAHALPCGTVRLAARRRRRSSVPRARLRVRLPCARLRAVPFERPGPVCRAAPLTELDQ